MIPSALEKARQTVLPHVSLIVGKIGEALKKAELPTTDIHDWRLIVDVDGILTSTEHYWIKAELAAGGWACSFKLRDSENEAIHIYLA